MTFNSETALKDIALSNPSARQVLEDSGLDYCCGGSKSLHEACLQADLSADEILNRLRDNAKNVSSSDVNWIRKPLHELTLHIREKHHRYVRDSIPRTASLLEKVISRHGAVHLELSEIRNLFATVGREMIMHMQKEEQILFLYIDSLELAATGRGTIEPPFFQTVKNPIHMMMKEHDAAGELVAQIRRLTNQYNPPADACTSFKALYQGLKEFESDLHEHVHLENNILFPRAVEIEAALA
jgi:regulator of cell morphogenesis and NO signaling